MEKFSDLYKVSETTARIVRAYDLFQQGIGLVQQTLLEMYGKEDENGYVERFDGFMFQQMQDLDDWFLNLYKSSFVERRGTLTAPAGGGAEI